MAYRNFKNLKAVVQQFGLTVGPDAFFGAIPHVEPSAWLRDTIAMATEMGFETEKERSERLVSPVLSELKRLNKGEITVYSGHELNVDAKAGLSGECDFLLTLGRKVIEFVDTPVFTVVEAKRQDLEHGVAQCTAQMVGAVQYNKTDGKSVPVMSGAATDGLKWRFLCLRGQHLSIDPGYSLIDHLPELLGHLQWIVEEAKKQQKIN